jgi:S1-C subfamily serine protease
MREDGAIVTNYHVISNAVYSFTTYETDRGVYRCQ